MAGCAKNGTRSAPTGMSRSRGEIGAGRPTRDGVPDRLWALFKFREAGRAGLRASAGDLGGFIRASESAVPRIISMIGFRG